MFLRSITTRSSRCGAWTSSSPPRRRPTTKPARCCVTSTSRSGSEDERPQTRTLEIKAWLRKALLRRTKHRRELVKKFAGRRERLWRSPTTSRSRWRSASRRASSWLSCRAMRPDPHPQPLRDHGPSACVLPQARHVAHRAARARLQRPDSGPREVQLVGEHLMVNDPLGDMLTRIRNAQMRRRGTVSTPARSFAPASSSSQVRGLHPRLLADRVRQRPDGVFDRAEVL